MISYWKCKDGFNEIHQWKSGCWIKVTKPTDEDLALLKERFAVPDFTHDAKDIEERPRVDHEDNWSLVFVRVPNKSTDEDGDTVFSTAPLAVLIRDDVFITVSYYDNEVLDDFIRWIEQDNLFADAVHVGMVPEVLETDEFHDERCRGSLGKQNGQ